MKIKFIGACKIVTGSCYIFTVNNYQFMLECGMFQGHKEITKINYEPLPYDPKKIKFLILSHAHIDHSGLIPKLCRDGFTGKIYCTHATKDLSKIMLLDSAGLHESEEQWKNKRRARRGEPPRLPLYTIKDAQMCLKYFKGCDYNKEIKITPEVSVIFRDAGHILGSAIVELYLKEKGKEIKFVFSGDLGQKDSPIVRDPTFIKDADYIMMETTYGDRIHLDFDKRQHILFNIIQKTIRRNGKVIIPSFAIERTQELLYHLNDLVEKNLLPRIKFFLDSPLAIEATKIFMKHPECYDEETLNLIKKKDNPFIFPGVRFIKTTEESKSINDYPKPCVIIAGSGMCTGGRIRHHLKHNLWKKENTILFIGYQAEGTLGRQILDGAKKVTVLEEEIVVNAEVKKITGYSAHADQRMLFEWLSYFEKPKKVFLIHGEPNALNSFETLVRKKIKFDISIPNRFDEVEL